MLFCLLARCLLLRLKLCPHRVNLCLGFLVVVLVVLLGWLPLSLVQKGVLPGLRNWLLQVPTTAGARGILIGVALGTLVVGLRVLVGAEWPSRE